MLSDQQIIQLLSGGESERVEWKASAADREGIKRTICALANNLGAAEAPLLIAIGLNAGGEPAGQPLSDELSRLLSGFRDEGNILPKPAFDLRQVTLHGTPITVVLVHPAVAPPVRLRGRVWVRIGATNRQATPEEERRLAERAGAAVRPFDLSPVPGASLADLRPDQLEGYIARAVDPEVLAANQRSREQQLASLRLVVSPTDPRPTVMGLLVAGRDPRWFMPGAYVQFARFDGLALTDPIVSQHALSGPLGAVVESLDELLRLHIRARSTFIGVEREVPVPDYPIDALRQLTRNAVMHRTYEGTHAPVRVYWFTDRVEVISPGGPYGEVNERNFGSPGLTDYRNPHLAEAMRVLGLVQRFGAGIPTARAACEKNANPPPEFNVRPEFVAATVRARSSGAPGRPG